MCSCVCHCLVSKLKWSGEDPVQLVPAKPELSVFYSDVRGAHTHARTHNIYNT